MTGLADALREAWADVKTPWGPVGNRRTYSVGTMEVRSTDANLGVQFSGETISVQPQAWPTFTIFSTALRRQVVVLQCVDENQVILWQRFFYGDSPNFTGPLRHANARAVSVWPGADEDDTRIAICGEVYDTDIPLEQYPAPPTVTTNGEANGFIAVFDGGGDLLWTHHAYGVAASGGSSAMTDISIRREGLGMGEASVDIVTYCGISTHGSPPNTPLSPTWPFANSTPNESNGATNLGVGQWDGFVGRVEFENGVKRIRFHSTMGGPGQDGLFGLAELGRDRFVVVGSALTGGAAVAFPGTGGLGQFNAGVVAVFDASPLRLQPTQPIQLEGVRVLGAYAGTGTGSATHLRDVSVGFNAYAPSPPFPALPVTPSHMIYVVGSSNNDLLAAVETGQPGAVPNPAMLAFNGASDGIAFSLIDVQNGSPTVRSGGFLVQRPRMG